MPDTAHRAISEKGVSDIGSSASRDIGIEGSRRRIRRTARCRKSGAPAICANLGSLPGPLLRAPFDDGSGMAVRQT